MALFITPWTSVHQQKNLILVLSKQQQLSNLSQNAQKHILIWIFK